ncbi:hypothetical protein Mgra_00004310, partial [Meloidogyne graminicola]
MYIPKPFCLSLNKNLLFFKNKLSEIKTITTTTTNLTKTTLTMEDTGDIREIYIEPEGLSALLGIPSGARSIVIFAHGSGSGRLSPRNNYVAAELRRAGMATLLLDLLRPEEETNRQNVFDIPLLASRLNRASEWVHSNIETATFTQGYFGASTGAGAALMAVASSKPNIPIKAVVSRGGRPDLAIPVLDKVKIPTLMLVGSLDVPVIGMNESALEALVNCKEKKLIIVKGATHLFEEAGTLDEVVQHAKNWFLKHLIRTDNREKYIK